MSKSLKVDKKIEAQWKKISGNKPSINYYIAEFTKKPLSIKLLTSGKGGINELKETLSKANKQALFGILRVVFYDDKEAPYPKFIYFRFLGSNTPPMTKGQLTPQQGSIDKLFPVKHISYQLDETLNKFEEYYIAKDFDRISENIVQIEYFDFGCGKYVMDKKAVKKGGAKGGGDFEKKEDAPDKKNKNDASAVGGDKGKLFDSLNKGGNVTKGLKKVTKDMKTKNRKDRSGKVTIKAKKVAKPKKDPIKQKRGPRLWCEGYYDGVLELKEAGLKDEIFITQSQNCGFSVPKKVKSVTLDSCKKVQIEVTEVVSMIEMINCTGCTVYLKENGPFINIDKCSNPKLVIFQKALDQEPKIVTSMTSDMNVSVPGETEESDWIDIPVPYQYKIKIDEKTRAVEAVPIEEH